MQYDSMKELVEQYGNPHFNVDRTKVRSNIWTKLAKALNIFQKKPYIEADKCVRCGICVNSCPVPGKAVDFRNGKNSRQFMTIRNVSAASAARKCARRRRLR